MTELNRRRVSAMLAADTDEEVRAGLSSKLHSHLHQFPDALCVKPCEWIRFKDLVLIIALQEFPGVVPRKSEGHLSQVIGPEAEELRILSYLVSRKGRPRYLDHGAHLIGLLQSPIPI